MADSSCENCTFCAKYDNNPKSFAGRFWRWHANWCPGWKQYMNSLDDEKRKEIAQNYNMKKYLN